MIENQEPNSISLENDAGITGSVNENEFSGISLFTDKDGQITLFDPAENYRPSASDYLQVIDEIINQYASPHYLSNLGIIYGVTKV